MQRHPLRPAGVAVGLFIAIAAAAAAPPAAADTAADPLVLGPHAGGPLGAPPGAPPQTPAPEADRLPPGTLGQVPADFELHAELILVSGQLEGFKEQCGFGRSPDRGELLGWYRHWRLARSMTRIETIYDLGVALGREAPCTMDHYRALATNWDALLARTRTYVEAYRQD